MAAPSEWLRALPDRAVDASVGDPVWAVFTLANGDVRVEPCHVLAVGKNVATVIDQSLITHEGVPGALIRRVGDRLTMKVGDLVTSFDWRHDLGIALVTRRDALERLVVKFRDSASVVREELANAVEPIPTSVGPFAWVSFQMPATTLSTSAVSARGLVFASDGTKLFVRDDTARGWVVDKSAASALSLSTKAHEVGDEVTACDRGEGYRHGKIARVFTAGFAYGVTFDGDSGIHDLYFSDFTQNP